MAGDYMIDKAQTIGDWKASGEPRTREVQEAREALRNLGLDVDTFVDQAQMQAAGHIPLDPPSGGAVWYSYEGSYLQLHQQRSGSTSVS